MKPVKKVNIYLSTRGVFNRSLVDQFFFHLERSIYTNRGRIEEAEGTIK